MSNTRCCGCCTPSHSVLEHLPGTAPEGIRIIHESNQLQPPEQRRSTFTGSGRGFSTGTRRGRGRQRRAAATTAPREGGCGRAPQSPSRGAACQRRRDAARPRSSRPVMDGNILTRTHRFRSCNQYTSPLAADVINDANTYFLINLPYQACVYLQMIIIHFPDKSIKIIYYCSAKDLLLYKD